MKKDDWYKNRILWRATQHDLFSKRCCIFSELQKDSAFIIHGKITGDFNPVIAFWGDQERWTVLGTRSIYSFHDGKLVFSDLDEISKDISVIEPSGGDSESIKTKSKFILLEKPGVLIWAPEGEGLFGLMNILLMFPLNFPE